MSNIIDVYLDEIFYQANDNRENINEVTGAILGLIFSTLMQLQLKATTKIDKEATKNFKELMKKVDPNNSKKKNWKIRIVKDEIPNAFTFGGDEIYMTDSLKDNLSEREVYAVLLHEVGHVVHLDVLMNNLMNTALGGVGLAIFIWILKRFKFGVGDGELLVFIFLVLTAMIPGTISTIILSKRAEYRADNYANKLGYGKELGSALLKLEKIFNQWARKNGHPTIQKKKACKTKMCTVIRKISGIFNTHPETEDRIKAMKKPVIDKIKAIQHRVMQS